jgi:hypothetical protein
MFTHTWPLPRITDFQTNFKTAGLDASRYPSASHTRGHSSLRPSFLFRSPFAAGGAPRSPHNIIDSVLMPTNIVPSVLFGSPHFIQSLDGRNKS